MATIQDAINLLRQVEAQQPPTDNTWREVASYLAEEIKAIRLEVQQVVENCKSQGLPFNAVEAEGFLRCAVLIDSIVQTELSEVQDNL